MFLVDKLSKKFSIAIAKGTFGLLNLLTCLLVCASLLTPAWRHAEADLRHFTPSGITMFSSLKLGTGLFGFACNYGIEQSAGNKFPIEGTDLCKGWAEVQSPYEKIASALVSLGLASSLVGFFWNLLAKRPAMVRLLPALAILPTLFLVSALVLFFVTSCRDTRIPSIPLGNASLNNTGCSIGYSYTLALLAFLLSLAAVLVGAVIATKVTMKRPRKPSALTNRKPASGKNKNKK